MKPKQMVNLQSTRRQFFGLAARGIGAAALACLLPGEFSQAESNKTKQGGLPGLPHFPAKAKRVIYLYQSGAPSTVDLLDYKPQLVKLHGTELPESIRKGMSLNGMSAGQASFPIAGPVRPFQQHGQSGTWVSDLLPHIGEIADDIAVIKTLYTDNLTHEPAVSIIQTGAAQPGRPSMGAWVSYGLGSENQNLPGFVVLVSQKNSHAPNTPLVARYWGSGFLPSRYQGVNFRASTDPVLYLSNPKGIDKSTRRSILDAVSQLNQSSYETYGDPEIETRIAQYEMAYQMQTSVPELMDISKEPESAFALYGEDARKPGTFAANCLLARRLAERNVRFIQLYHRGWDQHSELPVDMALQCKGVDQASAALVRDLKQRGMLDETLVIWGGEFGRTVYSQGHMTATNFGRDHHGKCFAVWMAGGGIKPGMSYGETDEFCCNIVRDPVDVHDLQATILHCLGIDHKRLTYRFQGREFRLTDVSGQVIRQILT